MIVGVDLELLKDADDPMLQRLQSSLIDDTDVVHELLHASGVRLALSLSPYAAAGAAGLADPCLVCAYSIRMRRILRIFYYPDHRNI